MGWFRKCKHQWKILKDERIKNMQHAVPKESAFFESVREFKKFYDLNRDTQHTILTCEKCGELRETIQKV